MVACYDSDRAKEELRFYPVDQQLDNHFCTKHPTDSRILTFSIRLDFLAIYFPYIFFKFCFISIYFKFFFRGNKLITLDMDSRIFIYGLSMKMNSKSGKQCIMVERLSINALFFANKAYNVLFTRNIWAAIFWFQIFLSNSEIF